MCRRILTWTLVSLAGLTICAAQALPVGDEFLVNTQTLDSQDFSAVAVNPSGGFVVVWTSYQQDDPLALLAGVFGQRYDAAGNPVGNEFAVNTTTADAQRLPAVASDSMGRFVVVWESYGQDGEAYGVFGRRFDSDGTPLTAEFAINTTTAADQRGPDIAMAPDGQFVVVWDSGDAAQTSYQDGSGYGVFGRRFDTAASPVGGEFAVNTFTTDSQQFPSIAMATDGSFVVTWESFGQDGQYYGVFGQRFNAQAGTTGSEFAVNSTTALSQRGPDVASDAAGNFIVVWDDGEVAANGADGSLEGVFAQRFNNIGVRQGGEFQVNSYTTNTQYFAQVSRQASGGFVVTWESGFQDGSGFGVVGRSFDTQGVAVGDEFPLSTTTAGNQTRTAVSTNAGGDFVVTWSSYQDDPADSINTGVYGQRFGGETFANDLIANFGTATYIYRNNAAWGFLTSLNAESFAVGDIDGNGQDDIVADFGSPTGVYIYYNDTMWQFVTSLDPELMVTANLNGNAQQDVVFDLGVDGLYKFVDGVFTRISTANTDILVAGDLDGSGLDDVVVDFGASGGVLIYENNTSFRAVTGLDAQDAVIGDFDGNAMLDVVFDFGPPTGVYFYRDGANFSALTGLDPQILSVGNLNGSGTDDLICYFGPSIGSYIFRDNSAWSFWTGLNPEQLVIGDLDQSGADDVVADFGTATYVYFNDGSWSFLTGLDPLVMATGSFDAPTKRARSGEVVELTPEIEARPHVELELPPARGDRAR